MATGGFLDELCRWLEGQPALARLAAEPPFVCYLLVWEGAIGPRGKHKGIGGLLTLAGEALPADGDVAARPSAGTASGCGGTGYGGAVVDLHVPPPEREADATLPSVRPSQPWCHRSGS